MERRWLSDFNTGRAFRIELAEYFESQPATARKAAELPWQLQKTEERQRLERKLLEIPFTVLLNDDRGRELSRYWVWLGRDRAAGRLYLEAFRRWADRRAANVAVNGVAKRLSSVLHALLKEAEELTRTYAEDVRGKRAGALFPNVPPQFQHLTNIMEKGIREDYLFDVVPALIDQGASLVDIGHIEEARPLFEFALALEKRRSGERSSARGNHPQPSRGS